MVTNAASFGRSGVHDFILLRASAVVLALYTVFLTGFIVFSPPLTYQEWHGLFAAIPMKIFTLLALISLLVHAWIGVWQVLSDYIKNISLRVVLQAIFVITALSYLVAGVVIVGGV